MNFLSISSPIFVDLEKKKKQKIRFLYKVPWNRTLHTQGTYILQQSFWL